MANMVTEGIGRWHLDRRISVGHVLTTIVVGVSAVLWLSNIENRVDLNARSIDVNAVRIDRLDARQRAALDDLKTEIRSGFDAVRADLRARGLRKDRRDDQPAEFQP